MASQEKSVSTSMPSLSSMPMPTSFLVLAELPDTDIKAEAFLDLDPSVRTFKDRIQDLVEEASFTSSFTMPKKAPPLSIKEKRSLEGELQATETRLQE
ncbi:hypothetical protein QVD17_19417 [Tagetes erecta]|uniref:Uncharacterized protein n=1 Tax=Tagetes erecta TaxID=13708 RepID=A0AAD8KQX9_TARER|nr:hypothetical protein QVD17_19417 [Tagetes erecta]